MGTPYYGMHLLTRNYHTAASFERFWRSLLCLFSTVSLCSSTILTAPVLANGAGSFRDIKLGAERDKVAEAHGELRAEAEEVALLLKIKPFVEKLRAAKASSSSDSVQSSRPIEQARLLCLWKIFIALEEVRKVVAVINIEIAQSNESFNSLMGGGGRAPDDNKCVEHGHLYAIWHFRNNKQVNQSKVRAT